MQKTKIHVFQKGNVKINHALIYYKSEDVAIILIDCKEKRIQIQGTSNCDSGDTLAVSQNDLDDSKLWKIFSFPEFKHWKIFLHEVSKYTLKITLVNYKYIIKMQDGD